MCSQHEDNEVNHDHEEITSHSQAPESAIKLDACMKERDEWKEKYLYARADFDNAQRRMAKDMDRLIWEGQAKVLRELVDILGDFERALAIHTQQDGFMLIYKRLVKLLDTAGVKEIEVKHTFDPEFHEAVAHVDAPEHDSGSVVEVLQKGYLFKNEILRPARVSVAK